MSRKAATNDGSSRRTPRFDVFYTNDTNGDYFPHRYLLDNYDEPLYYETIEEAVESVSEIVGHKVQATVEAIEEALNDYEEEHEDEDVFYSFHEFQNCED